MLSLKERHKVLGFLRYCSICCPLPITVDLESGDVRDGSGSKWKAWVSTGSYVLFLSHVLYKVLSLLYTLLYFADTPQHQKMVHFIVVSPSVLMAYWYYLLFIKYSNVNAGFMKITLDESMMRGKTEIRLPVDPLPGKFS